MDNLTSTARTAQLAAMRQAAARDAAPAEDDNYLDAWEDMLPFD